MKIYNMTEIKSLQKQRPRIRQLIAVCLALVMFFGTAFDYAIAFSERQNLDFSLESNRYDLLVDHEELFDLSHWQLEDNELTELPPGILAALLSNPNHFIRSHFSLSQGRRIEVHHNRHPAVFTTIRAL